MNSLRFRLVLLLILIGVIPCVLLRIGMLNSYETGLFHFEPAKS